MRRRDSLRHLERLQAALDDLDARTIAVPPFDPKFLLRGHAVHFRCHVPDASNIRLDVMARMRGVSSFEELWARRTTIGDQPDQAIELMSLPDLVRAKKTQRDKDWPMIRRLVEANYAQHQNSPNAEQIEFWLLESRTPDMLIQLAAQLPREAQAAAEQRPLLGMAMQSQRVLLQQALSKEQEDEREIDRKYWEPLKSELEKLRQDRRDK